MHVRGGGLQAEQFRDELYEECGKNVAKLQKMYHIATTLLESVSVEGALFHSLTHTHTMQ
jgi:hypothetical protein